MDSNSIRFACGVFVFLDSKNMHRFGQSSKERAAMRITR